MITKLTKEQEKRFPEFAAKWTRIGLSTEPANRPEAERGINEAYRIAGLEPPEKIVWCGSPLSQGMTRAITTGLHQSTVSAGVGDSVGASVRASVGDIVGDSVRASGYGQHDANWIGFYDYFRSACELEKETEKLCGLSTITKNAGWWLPHKNICWVSERHNVIHLNESGRLHKDESPAISYPDGWCIYALNGVTMMPYQVLTPAEKISAETVLQEPNVDRRRELIRKVGIERMLSKLPHKSLEQRGTYELLSIRLSDEIPDARYLRMVNPSVGVFHLEAVDPSCNTITESLNWRNSNWHETAEILT